MGQLPWRLAGAARNVQHQKRLKATADPLRGTRYAVRVFGGFFAVSNDDDGRWPRHQIAGTIRAPVAAPHPSLPLPPTFYCGSGSEANQKLKLLETILQI